MRDFIIETFATLPVVRRRKYRASSVATACLLALTDQDWTEILPGNGRAGLSYIAQIWEEGAGGGQQVPVPGDFTAPGWIYGNQFEILLGLLKILASDCRAGRASAPHWLDRAFEAIELAEVIIANAALSSAPRCATRGPSEDDPS